MDSCNQLILARIQGDSRVSMKASVQINKLTIQLCLKDLCILITMLALFWSLALWQINRALDKSQQQTLLESKISASAIPLSSLQNPIASKHQKTKVTFTGRYIDQSILIENTLYQGRQGYEVFTPFELSEGGAWLLISRGWHQDQSVSLPDQQLVQLTAEINAAPGNGFFLPPVVSKEQWPLTLHHFHLDTIKALYDRPIMNVVFRLQRSQVGSLQAHWPVVNVKNSHHFSYALQWFAFSIIALMIYIMRHSNALELLQATPYNRNNNN